MRIPMSCPGVITGFLIKFVSGIDKDNSCKTYNDADKASPVSEKSNPAANCH
jgi:hypothetical protein